MGTGQAEPDSMEQDTELREGPRSAPQTPDPREALSAGTHENTAPRTVPLTGLHWFAATSVHRQTHRMTWVTGHVLGGQSGAPGRSPKLAWAHASRSSSCTSHVAPCPAVSGGWVPPPLLHLALGTALTCRAHHHVLSNL